MHNRPQTISGVFYCLCYGGVAPPASLNSKLNDFQNPTLIRIFPFICVVPFSHTGILLVVFALTTVTQTPARINMILNITRSYGAVILFCLCNGKASCDSEASVRRGSELSVYNGTTASPSAWPAAIPFSTGETARQHLIGVRNTMYMARIMCIRSYAVDTNEMKVDGCNGS